MTVTQHILIILTAVLSTTLTRFLPFALFGLLAVYCFMDVTLLSGSRGLPELIAGAVVVALHLWKKSMMLTVAGGTMVYMLLVNLVF